MFLTHRLFDPISMESLLVSTFQTKLIASHNTFSSISRQIMRYVLTDSKVESAQSRSLMVTKKIRLLSIVKVS